MNVGHQHKFSNKSLYESSVKGPTVLARPLQKNSDSDRSAAAKLSNACEFAPKRVLYIQLLQDLEAGKKIDNLVFKNFLDKYSDPDEARQNFKNELVRPVLSYAHNTGRSRTDLLEFSARLNLEFDDFVKSRLASKTSEAVEVPQTKTEIFNFALAA